MRIIKKKDLSSRLATIVKKLEIKLSLLPKPYLSFVRDFIIERRSNSRNMERDEPSKVDGDNNGDEISDTESVGETNDDDLPNKDLSRRLETMIKKFNSNTALLADPSLSFLRDYLERRSAKLPPSTNSDSNSGHMESDKNINDIGDGQCTVYVDKDGDGIIDIEVEGEATIGPDNDLPKKMRDVTTWRVNSGEGSSQHGHVSKRSQVDHVDGADDEMPRAVRRSTRLRKKPWKLREGDYIA